MSELTRCVCRRLRARAQRSGDRDPPASRRLSARPGADPRLVRKVNYVYGDSDPERVTQLTNASGGSVYASYSYDDAGNQLTRSYPGTNELFEYVYDGKDQLRRVTRKLSGVVTGSEEYWYDVNGQRMAVVKRDASGAKTEMIWFIGDVEAHYDGAGAVTKIYSHLTMGTPVARVERTSNTTTSVELQFHGLASNTLAAVAQDGTINASFSYAPFGEVLEATGGSVGLATHKRRSNDKYEDDIGALAYYGARYYDKVLLGWTQADPLYLRAPDLARRASPRRSQVFMFSLNNPNRYVDPDGLDSGVGRFFTDQAGSVGAHGSAIEGGGFGSFSARQAAIAANNAALGGCNWFSQRCAPLFGGGGRGNAFDQGPCGGVSGFCNDAEDAEIQEKAEQLALRMKADVESARIALGAAVALIPCDWCPSAGFAIGMSGARNENEIGMQMVFWGLGVAAGGSKAARPTTAGSIRNVNAVAGAENCVACAIATDATLAGRPASALPGGPFGVIPSISAYLGKSAVGIPAAGVSGAVKIMQQWGPGARAIVWGMGKKGLSHTFNAVNQGGVVRFLDGQIGGAVGDMTKYTSIFVFKTN